LDFIEVESDTLFFTKPGKLAGMLFEQPAEVGNLYSSQALILEGEQKLGLLWAFGGEAVCHALVEEGSFATPSHANNCESLALDAWEMDIAAGKVPRERCQGFGEFQA
jgi:hypothetical protein